MGLAYSFQVDATVTSAGGDTTVIEIDPGSYPVKIIGYSFDVTSEVAEAQEEWLRMRVIRYVGGTFTTSNGTAVTARPVEENNGTAFGGAIEVNGTTIASSSGTAHDLASFGVPVRGGYGPIFLPPKAQWTVGPVAQSAMVFNMLNTLADDVTLTGTVWIEEGA